MRLVPTAHRGARLGAALVAACVVLLPLGATAAGINTEFFQGKTVTLVVSAGTGGDDDIYARVTARHLAAFIPGEPDVIVQNMPGAEGVTAGNYLYRVARQDGTVIGSLRHNVPFEPLMGASTARFDPLQFNWLGSPNSEVGLLLVWHTVPVENLADAAKRPVVVGGSGAASIPAFYARLLNSVFDTQLTLINGYRGQSDAFLAMAKGEVEGYPGTVWSNLKTAKPDWIRDNQVKILVQYGDKPHPDLPDVPVARNLVKSEADRQLLDVAMAPLAIGRPYVAPPNVPASRVAALRAALIGTFLDAAFLEEAEMLGLDVDETPQSGEDLRNVLMRTYAAPKPVLERLIAIHDGGQKQVSN